MREHPVHWSSKPFAELVESAVDGPFGSNLKSEHYVAEPGIRVVRLQNIETGTFDDTDRAWVSNAHASRLARHEVRPDDVLVASLGDENHPFCRSCVYPRQLAPGIVKADCFRLRLSPAVAAAGYYSRVLNCATTRVGLRGLAQGVTRDRVNLGNLLKFRVPVPPILEQRRIAEILDTIDDTIRKTEQLIQKLKQMKQGLLHDLLTHGVDENGELRDPERHPEQFRDSPLGQIPKGWTIDQLRNVGDWLSGGTPAKSQVGYWGGGVPWVCPKDMKRFVLDTTQETLTDAGAAAGTRFVPPGSIFLVVRGMILAHTFPVCLAATRMTFNQDVKGIVPRDSIIGRFLAHWFLANSARMLSIVTEATHGTKRIDLSDLHRQYIAIPEVSEQQLILAVLETHNQRLTLEASQAAKMRVLKAGLMEDLLTGRVPTTVLDGATA